MKTNGYLANDFTSATASQTVLVGTTLRMQIIVYCNAWSDEYFADNIVVTGTVSGPPKVADFSADNTTPTTGQTVNFTDLSTNTPTSWAWSFSPNTVTYVGGTNASSQNPQVPKFNAGGLYTVELTATKGNGIDTEIKTDYIDVTDCSGPLTLPWTEGFEDVGPTLDFNTNQSLINGTCVWSYEKTNNGWIQFGLYAHSGSQAAAMDAYPAGTMSENYIIATLNLSNYSTSTDLELSFWHRNYGEEDQPNDRVWIRGSNADPWIEIYDLYDDDNLSGWVEVTGLDIDSEISGAGQTITSTFQLRFGQEDNFSFDNDGRVFDDIMITGTIAAQPGHWTGLANNDWNNAGNWEKMVIYQVLVMM